MTKPVTIPNTFATATTAIPLSQLDSDFSTVATALNDANTYSNYAADTGVANAYVVTLTGVSTTYSAGLRIQFKAGAANTGASTLNVNGGGTKNITYQDASALSAGTIAANAIVDVMYDGTQFLLMNDPAGAIGDVVGPASSVDNQITLFNGVTGKVIKAATTGTGVVTALGVNTGSSGAFVVNGGALGTPSSGTVTNLTGTASININGTVGATTANTGAFTTLTASTSITEATYPVVSQSDIGTAPNEIPLNQYLGDLAYQDSTAVTVGSLTASGNIILSTAGAGIDFSATANSSGTMTSELLSDYEEGTFTPTITGGFTTPGYSLNAGRYTKVGRICYFTLRVGVNSGTRNASILEISLPFTSINDSSQSNTGGAWFSYVNAVVGSTTTNLPTLYNGANTNILQFYKTDGTNFAGNDLSSAVPEFYIHGWMTCA